jgi:long-chain acyl-CoA synthetase
LANLDASATGSLSFKQALGLGVEAIDGDDAPAPFTKGLWRHAGEWADRVAIREVGGRRATFAELLEGADRVARYLTSAGVEPGQTVATMLPNCIEFFTVYFATQQSGLYLTPVNYHLTREEVSYQLSDSGTVLVIAHDRFADVAHWAGDDAGIPTDRRLTVDELNKTTTGPPATKERQPGEMMTYTSGTTGRPKGVRRPLGQGDLMPQLETMIAVTLGEYPEHGVHLVSGPLYHRGPNIPAISALHAGQTLILVDRWDPEKALQLIEQYQVTTGFMVPTMFHRLLALPDDVKGKYKTDSLQRVIHSAAPCPVEVKRGMIEWWGPVIYESYGATEGGGTTVGPLDWLRKPGTVGKPWAGAEVHIFDDDGNPCPPNISGRVFVKSASPAFMYHQDWNKTVGSRMGDLITLGDVGYLDDEGFLFLNGRQSDMIITGGVNVYPAEIEAVLLAHPEVRDAGVIGVPDDEWGERVHAVVQLYNPADEKTGERLLEHCRQHLAAYKCPRSIEFRAELPRTEAGKLYKRRIRDEYWTGTGRQI